MSPPRGVISAAPHQCARKVLGYGGPGRPPPHAQIGRPGGLLVLFPQSKSTCWGCFYPARYLPMGSASCGAVRTILPLHAAEGFASAQASAASIAAAWGRSFRLTRSVFLLLLLARHRPLETFAPHPLIGLGYAQASLIVCEQHRMPSISSGKAKPPIGQ